MTSINQNQLYHFVTTTLNIDKTLDENEAKRLGLESDYAELAEELDVNEIDIKDILLDKDFYELFATLYVEEKERKQEAKDKETEKEEQVKVQDKNETGV